MKCLTVPAGNTGAVMELSLLSKAYDSIEHPVRPCILICPGGAYQFISDREGEPVAAAFLREGYQTAVLRYSIRSSGEQPPLGDLPLNQAAEAVRCLRKNSREWGIDPDKITILGCSAGAHLAGSLGVFSGDPQRVSAGSSCRPGAMILCYPVITSGSFSHSGSIFNLAGHDPKEMEKYSLEKHVSPDTCPAFIWQTVTDNCVPVENSLLMAQALQENKVPYELHLYTRGPHGMSVAAPETGGDEMADPHVATWISLALQWLEEIGLGPEY